MINPLTGASVRLHQIVLAALLTTLGGAATAGAMSCPDLANAVQVNSCPAEEELKHTYSGICSDSAKAYANQTDSCIRYEDYREMKNVALWESKDGNFTAYVSCDLSADKLKAGKATAMTVVRQGKLNKLVCTYPNGLSFTYRTKAACAVNNENACAADSTNCQATCD